MFEDEIVYVLQNDPSVERVIVLENGEHTAIVEKMNYAGLSPEVVTRESVPLVPTDGRGLSVVVLIQNIGYHANPQKLKEETYRNIGYLSGFSDGILLFYGMCGKAFADLESDFVDCRCPVSILKDGKGSVIDDCVACALGGNECYHELLDRYNNALFFTPMWASRWNVMFGKRNLPKKSIVSFFKKTGFNRLFKIKTGLGNESDFNEKVNGFAESFGFNVMEMKGSISVAEESYGGIKDEIYEPVRLLKSGSRLCCEIT